MIYKTLKKVSNVCQVLDKRKFPATTTIYGVTFTNNGDGSITVNGTATANIIYQLITYTTQIKISVNHKYLYTYNVPNISKTTYYSDIKTIPSDKTVVNVTNCYVFYTATGNDTGVRINIRVFAGYTADNLVFKPQLFDLTEMYGSGNEPATVEEFRSKFPNDLYDYSPRCFVTSYKNCLKVSDVCQLMDKRNFPATQAINGVTFTNNGDGTITANGTASAEARLDLVSNSGETLLFSGLDVYSRLIYSGCPDGGSNSTYGIQNTWISNYFTDNGNGGITYTTNTKYGGYYRFGYAIVIRQGYTANNLVFKPMCINLTEMYGAGHEPTTIEQFRSDFPNELYDYKPYSIVPSYKKSLICKTKNLFDNNQVYNIKGSLDEIIWSGEISAQCYFSWYQSLNSLKNPSAALFTFNYSDGSVSYAATTNELISRRRVRINSSVSKKLTSIVLCNWCYANGSIYNLQLELGSTVTEYHPYGYL